jgi:hypothetical protein
LLFTGCVTSNNFVVLRDVPPNPSFSVISATDYWGQHDFANQVEEALVNLGVAVITPPASKEVLTRGGGKHRWYGERPCRVESFRLDDRRKILYAR